jgi:hypothetical protein
LPNLNILLLVLVAFFLVFDTGEDEILDVNWQFPLRPLLLLVLLLTLNEIIEVSLVLNVLLVLRGNPQFIWENLSRYELFQRLIQV